MATYFISDLHLSGERPGINKQFLNFLENEARQAHALYILGDLFEYWIGDEAMAHPDHAPVVAGLKALADTDVPVYIMSGNRDFLIGDQFARETGCRIIPDPVVIDLYGKPVLIMHGDLLCTDDHDYQKLRLMLRDPRWIQDFLSRPVEERIQVAQDIREQSKDAIAGKQAEIMDVNQQTVEEFMSNYNVDTMIHGHTHRPDVHEFSVNGKNMTRIVLGDWYQSGSALCCDRNGCNNLALRQHRLS